MTTNKTYQLVIKYTRGKDEGLLNFGTNLEDAKREANHCRDPRMKNYVVEAAVYEVQTCWSEDRSYANSTMKKVY